MAMANITGTSGSDTITTAGVSAGVTGGLPGSGADMNRSRFPGHA